MLPKNAAYLCSLLPIATEETLKQIELFKYAKAYPKKVINK